MKCLLDPSSSTILFFFVALLMISTNTPTCLCNDYDRYKNCNNPFICGNSSISKQLTYPFWWEENREPNCGGIAYMGLTCEESVPKMLVGYLKYRILDWNKTTQMLKVARDDYWGGNICAVTDYKNVTFETTYFQLVGDQSSYVALLYNCDAKGNLPTRFYNMNCGADTTVVYTVGNPSSAPCSRNVTVVIIPIMRTRAATLVNTSLSLTNAIEEGFELKYTGEEFTECGRCVDSGGICGNDRKTGSFRCFCKDGPYTTTTCNSPKPTSSMSPISPEPTSSISPIFEPKKGSKSNRKRKMWLIVTGGSIVGFGIAIFSIVIIIKRGICGQKRIFWKRGKFVDHDVKAFMQSYDLFTVKRYNYTDLKRITNSFRDKVGQGGYGVVYKGCLSDGRLVAVKVISESKGSGEDFINEVASIGRTSHMNIVSLLGFCYEVNKRALIFEFMPNGSLDNFIYRSGFPNAICDFDWNTLFRIAIAIARGLEYLHQGCIARILHLDIKPQNILLDEDFCPKISDFGLAKICQKKESIVSIPGTRGTIGYMAPEVFSRAFGGVSHKSDVYSYGMLILEMIGGRNNHDTGGSHTTEMYFPDWIYKDLERGKTPASCLTISEEENEIVRKITMNQMGSRRFSKDGNDKRNKEEVTATISQRLGLARESSCDSLFLAPINLGALASYWGLSEARTAYRKSSSFTKWIAIRGPLQPNNIDCGYYVMKFMKDIINHNEMEIPITYFPGYVSGVLFSDEQLTELKGEWCCRCYS